MRYTVPNPHRDREVRSALALLRGISDGPSYSPDQQTAVSEELCLPAVLLQVTLLIDQISKSILSMDLELHKFKVNQGTMTLRQSLSWRGRLVQGPWLHS